MFRAGQSLTHEFDDSNLWAHGKSMFIESCSSVGAVVDALSA